MTPFPLVLSSPSGAGKSTIARALLAAREDLGYSVSATTRAPRPGETDGTDYHFLSPAEFERRVAAGEFVEWAEYSGARYGTLKAEIERILASGRHPVLDIEIDGARAMRRTFPASLLVFVVSVVGLVALDRIPPKPHLECRVHRAQTMSHYPHPYGEPPEVEWTTCVWAGGARP